MNTNQEDILHDETATFTRLFAQMTETNLLVHAKCTDAAFVKKCTAHLSNENKMKYNEDGNTEYQTKILQQGGYEMTKEKMRPMLVEMFEQFDKDNNGFLDLQEESHLVNAFITLNCKCFLVEMKKLYSERIQILSGRAYDENCSSLNNAYRTLSKEDFIKCNMVMCEECHHVELEKVVHEMLIDQLSRIDIITANLHKRLDTDSDGKISQDELTSQFYSAMIELQASGAVAIQGLDKEIIASVHAFAPQLEKEMKKRTHLTKFGSGVVLCAVVAAVAVAVMIWQRRNK
jgi:Ca2+-binding EF-hand superfamily protein